MATSSRTPAASNRRAARRRRNSFISIVSDYSIPAIQIRDSYEVGVPGSAVRHGLDADEFNRGAAASQRMPGVAADESDEPLARSIKCGFVRFLLASVQNFMPCSVIRES